MTLYNVHIYREMRLFFPGIDAGTAEEAVAKAGEMDTADADEITNCDGENLAARVDVVGDEGFTQSVDIDFEPERLREATTELLDALAYLLEQTVDMDLKYGIGLSEGEEDARAKALTVVAKVMSQTCDRRRP